MANDNNMVQNTLCMANTSQILFVALSLMPKSNPAVTTFIKDTQFVTVFLYPKIF